MSLMINFANHLLGTTIHCDAPTLSDEYQLSNLISDDSNQRTKGYLASSFIKLPVDITISFPYPIDIERIGIISKAGTCTSQTMSFYVSNRSMEEIMQSKHNHHHHQPTGDSMVTDTPPAPAKSSTTLLSVGRYDRSKEKYPTYDGFSVHRNFEFVCTQDNLHYQNTLYTYTCHQNFNYRQAQEFGFNQLPKQLNEQIKQPNQLRNFYSNLHLLTNVKSVRIRILKVLESKCAALGGIEIWGLPSMSVPHEISNQIYNLYYSHIQKVERMKQYQQTLSMLNSTTELSNSVLVSSPMVLQQQQQPQQQPAIATPTFNLPIASTTLPTAVVNTTRFQRVSLPIPLDKIEIINQLSKVSSPLSVSHDQFSIGTNNNYSVNNHHALSSSSQHIQNNQHQLNGLYHSTNNTPVSTPRSTRQISQSMDMENTGSKDLLLPEDPDLDDYLANHPEIKLNDEGVPTIFIDPITKEMMTDPVQLPSGNVVDRTTIEKHFANQYYTEPFTNLAMTMDQIQVHHVLKIQINSFINEKKKRKRLIKKNQQQELLPISTPLDQLSTIPNPFENVNTQQHQINHNQINNSNSNIQNNQILFGELNIGTLHILQNDSNQIDSNNNNQNNQNSIQNIHNHNSEQIYNGNNNQFETNYNNNSSNNNSSSNNSNILDNSQSMVMDNVIEPQYLSIPFSPSTIDFDHLSHDNIVGFNSPTQAFIDQSDPLYGQENSLEQMMSTDDDFGISQSHEQQQEQPQEEQQQQPKKPNYSRAHLHLSKLLSQTSIGSIELPTKKSRPNREIAASTTF